ncbi:MAG: ABC transporter substrate-binding protein, partial [Candidatus Eremiobacteraeota bacterium]|nr:ABC transporter substrate-binding protein [Candidatus Eremiobacteraeota bacterium]
MKRLVAAALLAAFGVAACAGSAPTRVPGAVLVVARVKDATSLDPSHETDGLSLTAAQEVYQNFVRFKPGTFDVVPDAARSWRTSPDGKTWTFRLKPGLRFSDGTPLDARAVKFNIDRWRLTKDPFRGNFPYGYYASMFGGFDGDSAIAGVDAPDAATSVIHLKSPFGPLLRDLAMPSFAFGSPAAIAKDGEQFGQLPVASGPYRVAEWDHDDHILLTANPLWSGRKPAYPNVYLLDVPDQSTSVLMMQKGDVDMLIDPRPDDAKALERQRDVRLYHSPSNNVSYLAMNVEKKPFDNVLVRRAVAYAIDKNALVRSFYTEGAVVADNWTPPGMLGENRAIKAYPHDVAMARALLARAGQSHFSTQLYYPTAPRPYMPEPQRIAEAIQANLRQIGIEVTLEPFEFAIFLQHVRDGDHPMCLIGWTGDNGDPDNFMYPLLDQDSAVKGQA